MLFLDCGPTPHPSSRSRDLFHKRSTTIPTIRRDPNEIYSYMAGTLKNLDCHPIKIGGVEDHVHVFSSLSKNIAFSHLIGRLKGASSKRLKEKGVSDFRLRPYPGLKPWAVLSDHFMVKVSDRVTRPTEIFYPAANNFLTAGLCSA
jgi:REP element-mobilizing transposase RayT